MRYNELGKTGIKVSELCFGSLTIGPAQADLPVERAGELLAYAFSKGINFVDTAELYDNYPLIREGLRRWGRDDIVISTKCYAYDRRGAEAAVEKARRELGRDVIDIFMLHEQESIHTLRGHAEALEVFYNYKAKGIIRAVGASTHHVALVRGAVERGLDVVFPMFNVAGFGIVDGTREDMERAVSDAYDAGIGVMTMKAFGGGNLFRRAEECLEYVRKFPKKHSTALGMQSEDEVDANTAFWETGRFPEEKARILSQKERKLLFDDWCEGCGSCVKKCSQSALKIDLATKKPVWDGSKCVFCGYCGTICPVTAIKVI